jgi:hypothetical protein
VLHSDLVDRLKSFGCELLDTDAAGDFWGAPPGDLTFRIPGPDAEGEVDDEVLRLVLTNQWLPSDLIRHLGL